MTTEKVFENREETLVTHGTVLLALQTYRGSGEVIQDSIDNPPDVAFLVAMIALLKHNDDDMYVALCRASMAYIEHQCPVCMNRVRIQVETDDVPFLPIHTGQKGDCTEHGYLWGPAPLKVSPHIERVDRPVDPPPKDPPSFEDDFGLTDAEVAAEWERLDQEIGFSPDLLDKLGVDGDGHVRLVRLCGPQGACLAERRALDPIPEHIRLVEIALVMEDRRPKPRKSRVDRHFAALRALRRGKKVRSRKGEGETAPTVQRGESNDHVPASSGPPESPGEHPKDGGREGSSPQDGADGKDEAPAFCLENALDYLVAAQTPVDVRVRDALPVGVSCDIETKSGEVWFHGRIPYENYSAWIDRMCSIFHAARKFDDLEDRGADQYRELTEVRESLAVRTAATGHPSLAAVIGDLQAQGCSVKLNLSVESVPRPVVLPPGHEVVVPQKGSPPTLISVEPQRPVAKAREEVVRGEESEDEEVDLDDYLDPEEFGGDEYEDYPNTFEDDDIPF